MIDCFSRKLWVKPMKRIDAEHTADAFQTVFKNLPKTPTHLVTDNGTEFFNSSVADIFEEYGVNHYAIPSKTPSKASMAERVIRTIKTRIARYMQLKQTNRWIDILDELVQNYNETPHSSTGYAPNAVNEKNQMKLYHKLYNDLPTESRLNVGDKVRTLLKKTLFAKGYTQNWSDEIYIITKVLDSQGVVWYRVSTFDGKQQPDIYYFNQLNLVSSKKY